MDPRFTNIRKHSLFAALLFFLDAYVMNQGMFSLLVFAISLFAAAIMLVMLIFKKEKELLRKRIIVAGIYAIAAVLVFVANGQNNRIAKKRATVVIAACEDYKVKRGAYPAKLSDLVPEFLREVPSAKVSLMYNDFKYYAQDGNHDLLFIALPPFGRPVYHLEQKKWTYLD